ncbi:MAG TPA: ABC transporter permease [Vicinamibacterales bacterium]|nr:ABC transporter permease [Vicinamibacterales bacterium]
MLAHGRLAIATLSRSPWFSSCVLLTFALGIGVNLAVFSVVDRVLFKPLPFPDLPTLVTVHPTDANTGQVYFTFPRAVAIEARRRADVIADLAYVGVTRPYELMGPNSEPLFLADASFNVLSVLGVSPLAGRPFTRTDAQEVGVRRVLLREETWRRRFGGSDVLRQMLHDERGPAEIVGVLPTGLLLPTVNWATPADGLLLTADLLEQAAPRDGMPAIFARLQPGKTISAAQQQFDALVSSNQSAIPEARRSRVVVEPIQDGLFWNCRAALRILFLGGCLVWLIAYINVGTLIFARWQSYSKLVAIRAALGASRSQLVLLPMVETSFLCFGGTALALVSWLATSRGLVAISPDFVRPLIQTSIDWRIGGVAVVCMTVGCVIAGAVPAWRATRLDLNATIRGGPTWKHSRRRLGSVLLFAEAAISSVLVLAGGLALASLLGLLYTDLGFSPSGLLVVTIRGASNAAAIAGSASNTSERLLEILRAQRSIAAAAFADVPPASGEVAPVTKDPLGRSIVTRRVGDQYFEAMGTKVIAGRTFSATDAQVAAPIVIMNLSAVHGLWPDRSPQDALGQLVNLQSQPTARLVGVVADTRDRQGVDVRPELFTPAMAAPGGVLRYVVRTARAVPIDAKELSASIDRGLGTEVKVRVNHVASQLEPWLQAPRLYALLFGSFGAIGLVLAALGLFSVASVSITERKFEVGVRLVLGATQTQILSMLVMSILRPVILGCAVGGVAAFWAARVFQTLLYRLDARDFRAYMTVAIVFVCVTVATVWRPGRLAARLSLTSILKAQ